LKRHLTTAYSGREGAKKARKKNKYCKEGTDKGIVETKYGTKLMRKDRGKIKNEKKTKKMFE
jgi:hypothetical protein